MKNKSECLLQSRWRSCCCNCVNRVRLLDNDNNLTQVGYGCKLPLEMGENWVSVGDFEHGMCECHEPLTRAVGRTCSAESR